MLWTVAFARDERTAAALVGNFLLAGRDMNAGVGEILDPTGMIEVEMRHDDMANIGCGEAQPAYLRSSSFLRTELRSVERQEEVGQPFPRSGDVLSAISGIDQDKAVVCLEKQAVAHQMC